MKETHRARRLRVTVIGPECTGKTTLARAVAEHYGVRWVPEFARVFVERERRAVRFADVDEIGRGQRAAEDEAGRLPGRMVVLDTDLVSTCVYSRHYYGDCPPWIEPAARRRLADLYLLLAIDVPWLPEENQREQPERREELYLLFERTLERFGAHVVEVRGTWAERREAAIRAIDALVASRPTTSSASARSSAGSPPAKRPRCEWRPSRCGRKDR